MKLSEMREILAAENIQLTKSLGQNFLHDANQIEKIVRLADLQPSDRVLEIGPGLGPLSEVFLSKGAHLLAVEKDQRLCQFLSGRFASQNNFQLICADALQFLKQNTRDWGGWKVVSNLPYSVGSPILVELATLLHPPQMLVVTLQLDVVQRILAKANDENYGQLSLFMQLCYNPADWFKIPAGSFFPPPDVDSACIRLELRPTPLLNPELLPNFYRIVKRAFSQRRKMMMKLLKNDWPASSLEHAYAQAQIPPQSRAESVSLEGFAELTKLLSAGRT